MIDFDYTLWYNNTNILRVKRDIVLSIIIKLGEEWRFKWIMINDVSIENFKTLKSIELTNLKRITLVSGRNNIGKSTFLEAIFLYMDHSAGESFGKLNGLRGGYNNSAESLWGSLFYQMETNNAIQISIKDDENYGQLKYCRDNNYLPSTINGLSEEVLAHFRMNTKEAYSLFYSYKENGYCEEGHFSFDGNSILRDMKTSLPGNELKPMKPTIYKASYRDYLYLVNELGNIELAGEKDILIKALKEMEPSIDDILTISVKGIVQLYIKTNGKLMPIQYAGDGIIKVLGICLSIMSRKNGIVLIDELENGLHYSMYGKLWRMLDHISKSSNCQVIATTHSYELISSVRNSIKNMNDFCYYRIGKSKEETVSFRYDYSMLDAALESEMEVR